MSFHRRGFSALAWCLPIALLFGMTARPAAADQGAVPVSRQLPDVEVHSLETSRDLQLARALAGRPAVLLVVDSGGSPACAAGKVAADLQESYAPWFSWVAVLSGEFSAPQVQQVRAASPMRLERLFLDRGGALRAALGIPALPALLLVDEDGAIHDICRTDESAERFGSVAKRLRTIAAGSRRRRSGFEDFRLPQVGREGHVSFLDVAGLESTIIAFVHVTCLPCARELEVLDYARDRQAGRASLVTVFLDDAPDSRIRGFLAAAGVAPDHVLRDPQLKLASRYGIETVPALLVVDAEGGIALTRSGYREEARDELYRDLEIALDEGALVAAAGEPPVQAARRIHEEAVAFLREGKPEFALLFQERLRELLPAYPSIYLRIAEAALAAGRRDLAIRSLARYLATDPQTYDSQQVRASMAGLLEPEP